MPDFLVRPSFNRAQNGVMFPVDSINKLVQAEYSDKFGTYQSLFGVYAHMTLTQDFKFKMHYMQGTPFMWQPHNNCSWSPTGTLQMAQNEIEPCRAKINEENCYDEYFASLYRAFLKWGGPTTELSPEGIEASNMLLQTIVSNATMGARLALSAGKLYTSSASFATGTSSRVIDAFRKTVGTCRGWIELCKNTAAADTSKAHLQTSAVAAADVTAGKYTADVLDLYDALLSGAPSQLQEAVVEGGAAGFGTGFYPLLIVSPSIFMKIGEDWRAQNQSALMNKGRISRQSFQITTANGPRPLHVYMIDDTVVIPLTEIGQYDQYLTGRSHFAYLTLSGVIQLGSSFGALPVVNESNVGILMQVSTNVEDYGKFKFLSHALLASAINDTNYITGSYLYEAV